MVLRIPSKLLDKLVEKEIVLRPENSSEIEANAYDPMMKQVVLDPNAYTTMVIQKKLRQLMKGVLDSTAFNNLIVDMQKVTSLAFEVLKIMGRRGVSKDADAYKLIIESYLRKGEPADAKTPLDSMIEDGHLPESGIFKSVMESLPEDGRIQTASRVTKSMVEK
ncbi:pentatricopeptide repeat-containing protein At2g37230-like [Hibiscus syriacus]|nr:pentatricopeptide repeat-containing protein At2g37230-like [Hibiscus syriacus]